MTPSETPACSIHRLLLRSEREGDTPPFGRSLGWGDMTGEDMLLAVIVLYLLKVPAALSEGESSEQMFPRAPF